MQPEILFSETHAFTQLTLWIPFIGISIVALTIHHFACRRIPATTKPVKRRLLQFSPVVILAVVAVLLVGTRLDTEVRRDGLFIQMLPFHLSKQKIELAGTTVHAVEVNPLTMYGGWGLRYGSGGTAYLTSGNKGVRIDYKDGKHIFIGSARDQELLKAIESIHPADR